VLIGNEAIKSRPLYHLLIKFDKPDEPIKDRTLLINLGKPEGDINPRELLKFVKIVMSLNLRTLRKPNHSFSKLISAIAFLNE
jgi:hypothetical protein